jgi:hypothetical protein
MQSTLILLLFAPVIAICVIIAIDVIGVYAE